MGSRRGKQGAKPNSPRTRRWITGKWGQAPWAHGEDQGPDWRASIVQLIEPHAVDALQGLFLPNALLEDREQLLHLVRPRSRSIQSTMLKASP